MKKLLLLLALFGASMQLQAQCGVPQSQFDLHGNNIRARILNGGDLFTDFQDGQFIPNANPNVPNSPGTIYAAGLWLGGLDPGANLKLAAAEYRGTSADFSAGPLNDNGITDDFTCSNWDKIFRVTGQEIADFLAALPMSQAEAIAQFPAIMGWPASGNATFNDIWGFDLPLSSSSPLAPYIDKDQNNQYTPLGGDHPIVNFPGSGYFVPAEMVWCVFNDQRGGAPHGTTGGRALQTEINLMAWVFNCPNEPVLNNTVFTQHTIINRGTENIDSMYAGIWVDFDLGCYEDDYVGCSPSRNTMYAYNQDAVDGQPGAFCSGVTTFADNPPVQTVTFLGNDLFSPNSLDKFTAYNSPALGSQPLATTDPAEAVHYYNYLSGSWRDGSPITSGGNGYGGANATDYIFPDDPADPNGWSMCSSNLPLADSRVLGSHYFGQMSPGQIKMLTTAWTVHYNTPPPCNLGNAMAEVDQIRAHHNNLYANVCSPLSKVPELPADAIELFPNPSTGLAVLRYGAIPVAEIRVYDQTGRLLHVQNNPVAGEAKLELGQLPVGIYNIQVFSSAGMAAKKLTILR